MATAQLDTLVRYIHGLAAGNRSLQRTDRQLLEDLAGRRDEAAFAALVARHGPMVLRVCWRVLKHEQDAEDAFQATFLILARKTGSIRKREALAAWLHGVAYRAAMEVKRSAGRRRDHECRLWTLMRNAAVSPTWDDVQAVLDEEIQRLPEPFRAAFVLCVLEGKSRPEAAVELGVKEGTASSRLARARQLLQQRLGRRGIQLTALLAAVSIAEGAGKAAVPAALAQAALRFRLWVAAGGTVAEQIPSHVAALAAGVTRAMFLTKAKIAMVSLFVVGLIAAGVGVLTHQTLAAKEIPQVAQKAESPARGETKPQTARTADESYGGVIVEHPTGKPASGVKVVVRRIVQGKQAGETKLVTDAAGRFQFDLPPDTPAETVVEVKVENPPGYEAQTGYPFAAGDRKRLKEMRLEKALGLANYFSRIRLFTTKEISGQLKTPDGQPAAGVDVVASSFPLSQEGADRIIRRTKTDAEGHFKAAVANPGTVVLYFLPEQYAYQFVKRTDPSGDLGTFRLEAGMVVSGKLRDVRNRPLGGRLVRVGIEYGSPEADVELFTVGFGLERWCRTEPNGTFRTAPLPVGEYFATASQSGTGDDYFTDRKLTGLPMDAVVPPQKVTVGPKGAAPIVLQAVPHVEIEIKVADRSGKPKAGVSISVRGLTESHARTGADGRTVLRVPHGAKSVFIGPRAETPYDKFMTPLDKVPPLQCQVEMKNVEADKTLEFIWMKGARASIHIAARDGTPLKGVEVSARYEESYLRDGIPVFEGIFAGRTESGGTIHLRNAPADVPFTIAVTAAGWEPVTKTVTLPAGATRRIDITLDKKK